LQGGEIWYFSLIQRKGEKKKNRYFMSVRIITLFSIKKGEKGNNRDKPGQQKPVRKNE